MFRDWLALSDLELAQKIDHEEKNGPTYKSVIPRYSAIRANLSRVAWNAYAAALDCDSGPLAKTGVIWRPIPQDLADRLLSNLLESPKTTLRRDDFAMGYLANAGTDLEQLNMGNEYREVTPKVTETLREFMALIGPELVKEFAHPFRIASTRQFQLLPGKMPAGRHVDGWPVSVRKMFILPRGVGPKSGTTWFRLRDGREVTLSSDGPIWAVFENSVVWHAPVSAEEMRPTIEFDFVPARKTSFEPYYAGINGWYPWFPTEAAFLEGTRLAASIVAGTHPRTGGLVDTLFHRTPA